MPLSSAAPAPMQALRRRAWRATIAVVALYALALQAVLGGASNMVSPDPPHILCQPDTGTDDGPSKTPPRTGIRIAASSLKS
ncbi:hypothetical protein FHR71_002447 [Methylobacterium sp. RAS18]|nr:hypothetical protein [Methylobacterium sp. RAS18]